MGINFPASPTVGQKHPQPAVAGTPVYTWDGEKWTTIGGVASYAPFDAMAYSGMQINGGMEVNQAGVAATANGQYACDGWVVAYGGLAGSGANQDTNSPIPGLPGRLYTNSGTAKPSLAATDYLFLMQVIEGYRVARLGWGTASAQPITIAFWSEHTLSGTYTVAVRNGATNRSYVATYTQNVANTLEYKTITVPGDTIGTWEITNGYGMQLSFALASGTTYTASSANAWLAGNFLAAPGQINGASATGQYLVLRGVSVLPGTQAPTAAQSPNSMRPYGEELATCQRYYEKGAEQYLYQNPSGSLTNAYGELRFVTKRAVPTVTALTQWQYWSTTVATNFTPVFSVQTTDRAGFQLLGATNWNGWCGTGTWSADARL